ncbi:MAG: hypothetical protein LZF86_220040 [Nitrospira sp.]|nr:MAG: hypothetical protein LZF86_220040 [Nitrospira sp.]
MRFRQMQSLQLESDLLEFFPAHSNTICHRLEYWHFTFLAEEVWCETDGLGRNSFGEPGVVRRMRWEE